MNFIDGSLFVENMQKLVITAAPYGPEWEPGDFPEDIPVTMDEQVQKAVDCYNAGASVLHIHVRELNGKGSKRLSQFNELLGRLPLGPVGRGRDDELLLVLREERVVEEVHRDLLSGRSRRFCRR